MNTKTVGFLGAGNMAGAIIGGIVGQELYPAEKVWVYDTDPHKIRQYTQQGHPAAQDVAELTARCDLIVLSVKPQVFPAVLPLVREAMTPDKLLVSIAAGITAESIQQAVGFPCKVVRVMPNTPLLVGEGAAALSAVDTVTPLEFENAKALFAAAGLAVEIPMDKMNAVIPVHGSSPAFIYLMAKTMVDWAARQGIDPEDANALFCKTLVGCARMMTETGRGHQELIDMVCSPGGTTLAALEAMEKSGFTAALTDGFDACVRRAEELAR